MLAEERLAIAASRAGLRRADAGPSATVRPGTPDDRGTARSLRESWDLLARDRQDDRQRDFDATRRLPGDARRSPRLATPPASTSVHSSGEWVRPPGPPRPMVSAGMPMLIGMLLSVLLMPNDGFRPKACTTAAVVFRIGASIDVSPHGRSPITLGSASMPPFAHRARAVLVVDRALDDREERRVHLRQLGAGLGPDVDVHADFRRDRVDRRAAADHADVEGGLGRRRAPGRRRTARSQRPSRRPG